ncbi:DUF4434 domain-containing protein [uncultured Paludibaculum sp.]|uniref:DUF4434 domain-containing protein n=1 Tax=uncultured Paludibaculum sp. TaxID=1765020 RepID=UPI002AABF2A2|nr:DUF4434 domain-containing protein [uncultured Paludibaculum sp.]
MTRREALKLAAGAAVGSPAAGGIGTFLQFWRSHQDWDAARWSQLFGYLSELHVRELVIQWTRYDGIDYAPLTARVLELADQAGMSVWVGLAHESSWWRSVEQGGAAAQLGRIAERHLALAQELNPAVRGRAAFRGWYLPEEIDDGHWAGRAGTEALRAHVSRLHRGLRPLAMSGFSNAIVTPADLGSFWKRVAGGGLEKVLFQDGIGARPANAKSWPERLDALSRSLGRKLTVVVEIFEPAGDAAEFRGRPAPWSRIEWQLVVARRSTRNAPVLFSLPEYATPMGGDQAARLYEDWRRAAAPR